MNEKKYRYPEKQKIYYKNLSDKKNQKILIEQKIVYLMNINIWNQDIL